MIKALLRPILICIALPAFAQTTPSASADIPRPKLVVGIVIDQMRWDYLYRYYSRYQNNGFKRLLNNGFSCENTFVPYIPSVTACGHSSIYTGSVPAINGITGNEWYDYDKQQFVYCTGDSSVKSVGGTGGNGQMSPRNLLVTTIGDELRLATNYRSKVIGIALKDRAAILPAGNSANAAYWYDEATGNWISSSYYMDALPKWVQDLNAKKMPDKYYAEGWTTLYPLPTYQQSTAPKNFPYDLKTYIGKNYNVLHVTPFGNNYTFDMAEAAITGEQLGAGSETDMLTLSLSTPDYIGHTFGPNSVEAEDDFLRLDKELGNFIDFLDTKIGKDNYLLFLTADHGAPNAPGFLREHKIPSGNAIDTGYAQILNTALKSKFGSDKLVMDVSDYQVRLDRKLIKKLGLDKDAINAQIVYYLSEQPAVYRAFALDKLSEVTLNSTIKSDAANGYYPERSGDIQILFKPQWIENFERGGTTHGAWNPYDAHIPLIWYGWHIKQGHSGKEFYMTDIAPTVTNMLHIQMPGGCIGHVIEEAIK